MPSLRELQQAFADAVLQDAAESVLRHVRPGAFPAARHLQIYRNNTFANLTDALAAVYPVIQRLVGVEFYAYAADSYIRRHPPRSGNLHDFGGAYAEFLREFAPAQSLSYLPDVADLEWAWHHAFHAADAQPFAMETLRAVAPELCDSLVFQLHPSVRLLQSDYPVLPIWQANQADAGGDATVDLDRGGARLLVIRRGLDVEIEPLEVGEYALLRAFAEGQTLAAADAQAVAAEPELDLMRVLYKHIQAGVITGFTLNPQ